MAEPDLPPIGADVSHLVGDLPPIGADVSHLLGHAAPEPATHEPGTYAGGFVKSLGATAKGYVGGIAEGVGSALNPMNIVRGHLAPFQTNLPADASMSDRIAAQGARFAPVVSGVKKFVTDAVTGQLDPNTGGQATGQLLTGLLAPRVIKVGVSGAGRLLTKAAPQLMDMGLKRTAADRLAFPGTPQRLVDEGIIPRGQNVQNALTATEAKVNADAAAFDAANPPGVDPSQLATSARDFAYKEGKVGGLGNVPGPDAAELDALKQGYLAQNTRARTLAETLDQKRAYAARAKFSSRPNAPTQTGNELNFNEGVAGANRTAAIQRNPALEGDLAKEQDLMGGVTAQANAEAKATPLSTVGLMKTVAGLRNPTVMGGAGIAADRIGQALQSPYTSTAIRTALLALMSGR